MRERMGSPLFTAKNARAFDHLALGHERRVIAIVEPLDLDDWLEYLADLLEQHGHVDLIARRVELLQQQGALTNGSQK